MRKKIIAANWKMNNTKEDALKLLVDLVNQNYSPELRIIIAPAFTQLAMAAEKTKLTNIEIAAQNISSESKGAYTGEVSAAMIKSEGVRTTILGHSERRALFNETNDTLKLKVRSAISEGLEVIYCFGEELNDRKLGNHFNVVKTQLKTALFNENNESWNKIILAYEPIWAIGTGENASPEQIQEMHMFIRDTISEKYGELIAKNVSILYGGSIKPNNAKDIFSEDDVDGGLIGGASLNIDDFSLIVNCIQIE
ncbi:MAG: triose-phosphate isomerase [Flavobacteriaceae bacterium]|nr:triose-phosphate isomerase [Flavobacteriaceae bacterium]|tara:strand:- start:1230 stop:1988 length:759 start_codon:yes stop_codon:yes gene_type:complete